MTTQRMLATLALVGLIAAVASTLARATTPGQNGSLLFFHAVGKYDQVFSAWPDGTHVRQLTHLTDSGAANGSWSPDGKRVAFARDYDCCTSKEHLDIYTMNADGSALHGLGLKGLNGEPIWFPDGRRLLFGHRGGLWVIPASVGKPHLLLEVTGDMEGLALSPSGREVALIRYKRNGSALFVAQLGSGRFRQVTPWSTHAHPKVDWSPDGSLLLSRTEKGAVFTVHPDGSELRILARGHGYCSESFSPDGTKILFIDNCSSGGKKSHLFTMNLDGSGIARIPGLRGHWVGWAVAPR
ncbi:MAG TPA: hypothetical protein VFB26_08805 [Gaiellaceae bacterium]|nr:hypothetical protein [Gaiellaceae bacterium]